MELFCYHVLSAHPAPVRNFSSQKKNTGPQRKQFSGRFGFLGLSFGGGGVTSTANLESSSREASNVFQMIVFRLWSCMLSSFPGSEATKAQLNLNRKIATDLRTLCNYFPGRHCCACTQLLCPNTPNPSEALPKPKHAQRGKP